jgi:hypothetical protein
VTEVDKRYQVFISSTFEDLKRERQEALKAVLLQNHMPAGMELFPALDADAWRLIADVIDQSDYYLLIIAGRYGSRDEEGLGYTEKEYEYALEKQKPVIALLHSNPDNLPRGKTETDEGSWNKLAAFRAKVEKNHHCAYWQSADELKVAVILGLSSAVKNYPGVGWIRADKVASEELLREINDLRKENESLKQIAAQYEASQKIEIPDIASLDEEYEVHGTYTSAQYGSRKWSLKMSWRNMFALIGPFLLNNPNESHVESVLANSFYERTNYNGLYSHYLNKQTFQTIKIQFMALKLINVKYLQTTSGGMAWFWSLTGRGEAITFAERTVKATSI